MHLDQLSKKVISEITSVVTRTHITNGVFLPSCLELDFAKKDGTISGFISFEKKLCSPLSVLLAPILPVVPILITVTEA